MGELVLGGLVQVGAELGEDGELAVLGEVQPQAAGDLATALVWAAPPTRETERPTSIAGR